MDICEPESRISPDTESADILTLNFLTSKLWEMNFCFYKTLIYGILL